MPRIAHATHEVIRQRVEVGGHSVVEVAAAHGCTPANIYRILAELRRRDGPDTTGSTTSMQAAGVQKPAANQTAQEPIAALGRLQKRFDRLLNPMEVVTSLPHQDDVEARQQWLDAVTSTRTGNRLGQMRTAMALAREIGDKTTELRRRLAAKPAVAEASAEPAASAAEMPLRHDLTEDFPSRA